MRIGINCLLLQADIGGLKQYFTTLFRHLFREHPEHTYVFFHFGHNRDELSTLGTDEWKPHAVLLNEQSEIERHLNRIDMYSPSARSGSVQSTPAVVMLPDIQETAYPEFSRRCLSAGLALPRVHPDRRSRHYHLRVLTTAIDRTPSDFVRRSE